MQKPVVTGWADLAISVLSIGVLLSVLGGRESETRILPLWFGALVIVGMVLGIRKMAGLRFWAYVATTTAFAIVFYGPLLRISRSFVPTSLVVAAVLLFMSALSTEPPNTKRSSIALWLIAVCILGAIVFWV